MVPEYNPIFSRSNLESNNESYVDTMLNSFVLTFCY